MATRNRRKLAIGLGIMVALAAATAAGVWLAKRSMAPEQPPVAATTPPAEPDTLDFTRDVLRAQGPVLVDFWAPWCGPCREMAPVVEQFAGQHPELSVVKVNVDEHQNIADRYGITAIPTIIFFRDGKEKSRSIGIVSPARLAENLRKAK